MRPCTTGTLATGPGAAGSSSDVGADGSTLTLAEIDEEVPASGSTITISGMFSTVSDYIWARKATMA